MAYLRSKQKIEFCIAVNTLNDYVFSTRPRLCLMGNHSNHLV